MCCKVHDSDGARRMADMIIIDLTKKSLSNQQILHSNSAFTLGKVAEPSVLHEDVISYDVQLDTISVIEVNISKHPCSHGSMIRLITYHPGSHDRKGTPIGSQMGLSWDAYSKG